MDAKELRKDDDWVESLLNMARRYRAEDQPEIAMDIYRELEQSYLTRGIVVDPRLGGLYHNMMEASGEAGNRKEALYCGKRAIEILELIPECVYECAAACTNLAGIWLSFPGMDEDRLLEAADYLKKGEELFLSQDKISPHYAVNLDMQATTAYWLGNDRKALELFEKALSMVEDNDGHKEDYERISGNIRKIRMELKIQEDQKDGHPEQRTGPLDYHNTGE